MIAASENYFLASEKICAVAFRCRRLSHFFARNVRFAPMADISTANEFAPGRKTAARRPPLRRQKIHRMPYKPRLASYFLSNTVL